jgi:ribonuclease P protein subunit POP4
MKVTPDIVRGELIGTQAEVSASRHEGYHGLSGRIVDETRNTFTIIQAHKAKRIVKENAVFRFTFSDGTIVQIDGKLLTGRPEDRLKKTIKRLW